MPERATTAERAAGAGGPRAFDSPVPLLYAVGSGCKGDRSKGVPVHVDGWGPKPRHCLYGRVHYHVQNIVSFNLKLSWQLAK